MSPRALSATAMAAAAALTLLLTACGSDEDDGTPQDDKIQGADKAKKSPSSSASEAGEGRPEIKLPDDVTYEFAWSETGDPDKDAVLRDTEERIKSLDMAIAEQDPAHAAYRFYYYGEAAAGAEETIQRFVDHKARTTGTVRYYAEQLSLEGDGTANLIYCEDQSKAFNKFLDTGKVDKTPVTADSYVVYNTKLRKGEGGVWITEQLISERGAAQCQP